MSDAVTLLSRMAPPSQARKAPLGGMSGQVSQSTETCSMRFANGVIA
jgi:hypothetical protein